MKQPIRQIDYKSSVNREIELNVNSRIVSRQSLSIEETITAKEKNIYKKRSMTWTGYPMVSISDRTNSWKRGKLLRDDYCVTQSFSVVSTRSSRSCYSPNETNAKFETVVCGDRWILRVTRVENKDYSIRRVLQRWCNAFRNLLKNKKKNGVCSVAQWTVRFTGNLFFDDQDEHLPVYVIEYVIFEIFKDLHRKWSKSHMLLFE